MNRQYSSKTAVRILCALFVLISAAVAVAGPVESVQAQAPAQQQTGGVTDTWAVQISPGTDPDQLALRMGAQNLGQIGALTDYYLFRIPGTDSELTAMADVFAANSQVVWFEQQVARQQSKRVIEDPVYQDQWHLVNANVEPAWTAGFTGTGVNIAIVDDGLEYTHLDLSAQYVPSGSYDFNDGDSDPIPGNFIYNPMPPYQLLAVLDTHGTSVAGIAAADYNGNTDPRSCGVGVAYDAGLSGLRLIAAPSTDAQEAAALNFGMNPASLGAEFNSIYNNSWGPIDGPDGEGNWQLAGPGPLTLSALQAGVTSGRNGKGSIYVWAAGNGLIDKDNVNYDGYANSRYTIAVGALGNDDTQAPYSEPGAAMLVTAPGGISGGTNGIVTTDLLGHWGESSTNCTEGNFDGTSASAPLVSGVVALMLEANPNLGWRDVQNILARTAAKNDPTDADWDANPNLAGVQNNGAGLHVNHKYGFGLVDAAAAVAMAADPLYVNLRNAATVSSGVIVPDSLNRNIVDADPINGVSSTFNVSRDINLEHVEVIFNSSEDPLSTTGGYRGDLKLVLTSPSGTESVLSEAHADDAPDYTGWKFMTVRNWGESSLGTWTLRVTDEKGGGVSVFDSWQLILHGTGNTANVDVIMAGNLKGSYALFSGSSDARSYVSTASGPVRVGSTNHVPIVGTERVIHYFGGVNTSYYEMMGLPAAQLSTEYWYPYNSSLGLNTQIRFSNAGDVPAEVEVWIAGSLAGSYTVQPNTIGAANFYNIEGGPVQVKSTNGVPIISTERFIWTTNGVTPSSFAETMGMPFEQLSDEYWFPFYNNISINSQLRVANAGVTDATVQIQIAGSQVGPTYTIPPNVPLLVSIPGVAAGPVRVVSTNHVPIVATERVIHYFGGVNTSYYEMMGLPAAQLSTEYWYPYNSSLGLNTQIRFSNAGNVPAEVEVWIAGSLAGSYTVQPNTIGAANFYNIEGGPVQVKSTNGVPIISTQRFIWTTNGVTPSSFAETMGMPVEQLSDVYWFPFYNNVSINSQIRIGIP